MNRIPYKEHYRDSDVAKGIICTALLAGTIGFVTGVGLAYGVMRDTAVKNPACAHYDSKTGDFIWEIPK